jgi:hypothetical protein
MAFRTRGNAANAAIAADAGGQPALNWDASTNESLRRVFTDGFAARDIAEPPVSFDDLPRCRWSWKR